MLKKLLEFIIGLFSPRKPEKKVEPKYNPKPVFSRNERVLAFASKEIGVKEVRGKGNNAQVLKYHAYSRQDNDLAKAQPDSVPWCSSFVCYCVEMVGMGSTNSMAARSWLKWGISTKHDPLPGDIVVFWRGSKNGWMGHVGIFVKKVDGHIYVLGGNQNDEVNISTYSTNKLLDIRRSSLAKISGAQRKELATMSIKIRQGSAVEIGGKVA